MQHRPRRSCLYMPGANPKALEKAKSLPADVVILDLEDSVAPEAKADARAAVKEALRAGGYGKREVVVRVNALTTPWGVDDVLAVAPCKPDAILFPKVDSGSDVRAAQKLLDILGAVKVAIWVMIETPKCILNIANVGEAAHDTKLTTFVMGTNDLAKEMRCAQTPDRAPFLASLSMAVLAGRANGLTLIDGVYNDIEDAAGFEAVCRQGLALGFDGKTLIHPTQIATCNTVFAPTDADIAQSRDVIAAFAAPENAGKGVLKVNGKMTELLHLEMAQRTVAVADAIAAMG